MSRYGLEIVRWSALDRRERAQVLARPQPDTEDLRRSVAGILNDVRENGDAAVKVLTRRYDGADIERLEAVLPPQSAALRNMDPDLARAIEAAAGRIRAFHAADQPQDRTVETASGLTCRVRYRPLSPVGLYAPGGSAPLISTVLMLAIPARLAGCSEVILCTPPDRAGQVAPEMLAVAAFAGVDRVFSIGGAQAIAAMAYGTESVPRCSKLFGPGNAWVTEAKLQVSTDPHGAAIDLPAGPSEVMVVADGAALENGGDELIAWDLLSQAEHGPDSQVLLVSDNQELARRVISAIDRLGPQSRRAGILVASLRAARILLVDELADALDIANEYAPEHLILNIADAAGQAERIERAGSVFIGRWTPESLGDYCSGTNHVLPTFGWARSYGALGVGDFMRRMTIQQASEQGLRAAGPDAAALARFEGLHAHEMAVTARLANLGARP